MAFELVRERRHDEREKKRPAPNAPAIGPQPPSILRQLAALQNLTADQLKCRWRDLCGSEPPAYNRHFLIRRLAYRIQELHYGGISQAARETLQRTAQNDPAARLAKTKSSKSSGIADGMRFVRLWQGRRYEVVAAQGGFDFDGQRFRSLSAVAKKITGAHWNGRVFFGVKSMASDITQGRKRK